MDPLDAFAAGETVSSMAAWGGLSSVVIGGRTAATASALTIPSEPLTGFGDPVSSGDLVTVNFQGHIQPVILNFYSARANRFNFIAPSDRNGLPYNIWFASLRVDTQRRIFKLVEPATPGWSPIDNISLDALAEHFDERFARVGFPRRLNLVDNPIVASGTSTMHAVPLGLKRSVCGLTVSKAKAGTDFDPSVPKACKRCLTSVAKAGEGVFTSTSVRSVRHNLYVGRYRKLFYAPQR